MVLGNSNLLESPQILDWVTVEFYLQLAALPTQLWIIKGHFDTLQEHQRIRTNVTVSKVSDMTL